MREGSRNEKSEHSVGNILLSSQRKAWNGPVGGAASGDSIRFRSNFASFRLICPFVFSWSFVTLFFHHTSFYKCNNGCSHHIEQGQLVGCAVPSPW